ncbi:MAG: hypothetical protein HYY10_01060 [Candidatus Liptonbacteria bacterium]|nr:hypothetical protein [Candidatus Liptonbacteria bacterium]
MQIFAIGAVCSYGTVSAILTLLIFILPVFVIPK